MTDNDTRAPREHAAPDHFLQLLVRGLDTAKPPFGITLFLNGIAVSGELISEEEYFKGPGLPEDIRDRLIGEAAEAREEGLPAAYVHLAKPTILYGEGSVGPITAPEGTTLGGALRIRLASVDAWLPLGVAFQRNERVAR